jgi:tetratricopeptide (TPR) repeat protein
MRTSLLALVGAAVLLVGSCATAPSATERRPLSTANLKAGVAALEAKEFDEAVRQLEIAIVADPKSPDGYFRLGQSHRGRGDFHRALKYIRLALQIRPNHLAALYERGSTELAAGEREAAVETLEALGEKCGRQCEEYESLKKLVEAAPKKSGG